MASNSNGGVMLKRLSSARDVMGHRSDDSAGSRSSMNRSARHSRGRYKLALTAGPDSSSTLVGMGPSLDVSPKLLVGRGNLTEEVILEYDNSNTNTNNSNNNPAGSPSKNNKKKKPNNNNNNNKRKSVVKNIKKNSSSSNSSTEAEQRRIPRRLPMVVSYPLRLRALNSQLNETTLYIVRDSTTMDDLRNTTAGQLGLFARRFFRANGDEILDISDVYVEAAAGQDANKPLMLYVSNGKDFKEAQQVSTGQQQQPTLLVTVTGSSSSTHHTSASASSVASASGAKGGKSGVNRGVSPPMLDINHASEQFTVAVLGGERVGKTSLVVQYLQHFFLDNPVPTIEDVYTSLVDVEGSLTKLEIVDTAGQCEFEDMRGEWMTKADGYLFVYSMTSSESMNALFNFYEIHRNLVKTRSENMLDKVPFILVANNKDVADRDPGEIQVSRQRAHEIAKDMGVPHFEVSALTGENVDKVFAELVKRIRQAKGGVLEHPRKVSTGGALARNLRKASLVTGRTLHAVKRKSKVGRSSVTSTNPLVDRSMAEQLLEAQVEVVGIEEGAESSGGVSAVGQKKSSQSGCSCCIQ